MLFMLFMLVNFFSSNSVGTHLLPLFVIFAILALFAPLFAISFIPVFGILKL